MRRVPLILFVLLALVAGGCAGNGQLGGPDFGGTVAAKVGDTSISNADLQSEVDQWATNPEFLRTINVTTTGTEGRRSAELVSFVLSHRIISEQARQLAAANGYEPTPEEIDQILASVDQNFTAPGAGGSLFRVYSDQFRHRLATDLAYQNNLQNVMTADTVAPSVEVNPRYGELQLLQGGLAQVDPPTGPRPAPVDLAG